jgi:hypothetical protein
MARKITVTFTVPQAKYLAAIAEQAGFSADTSNVAGVFDRAATAIWNALYAAGVEA